MFDDFQDVVGVKELMQMLGIGRNNAYKMLEDEEIKAFKVGRKYRIPKASVINYITRVSEQ